MTAEPPVPSIAPDGMKDAARRLRWHNHAKQVLGECSCIDAFRLRNLIDPGCMLHQCRESLIEALSAEYLQGCADQRHAWMGRVTGRHGG